MGDKINSELDLLFLLFLELFSLSEFTRCSSHILHTFQCVLCFILISYCSIFKDRFAAVFTAACTLYHKWTGLVNSFLKNFLSFFRVFLDTQNMVVYTLCKPQYIHRLFLRTRIYIINEENGSPLAKRRSCRDDKITKWFPCCYDTAPNGWSHE